MPTLDGPLRASAFRSLVRFGAIIEAIPLLTAQTVVDTLWTSGFIAPFPASKAHASSNVCAAFGASAASTLVVRGISLTFVPSPVWNFSCAGGANTPAVRP